MIRRRVAGVLVCAAVLVAASCSGDDDTSADNATPSTTATSTTAITDTTLPSTDTTVGTPGGTGVTSNTLSPVGVGAQAELGSNVFVTVTKIEPTSLTARGPGEVSGPGVLVTVDVRNASDTALDLAGLVVNAHYGDGTPAVPAAVQQDALAGMVAPGDRKSGTYAFSVPTGQDASVVLDVQHSALPNVVIVDASP